MITGKTKLGFNFSIKEEMLDNWEVVEQLALMDEGNMTGLLKVGPMLLGEKQFNKLKAYVKKKGNGIIRVSVMTEEITSIIKALSNSDVKNS